MPYLFVFASIIAVAAISFMYKMVLTRIIVDPDSYSKNMTKFFIGTGIGEAIPIILLVIGLANIQNYTDTEKILLPLILIVLLWVSGIFFIFLQRKFAVGGVVAGSKQEDIMPMIRTFSLIAIGLIGAIPIASFIALLTAIL